MRGLLIGGIYNRRWTQINADGKEIQSRKCYSSHPFRDGAEYNACNLEKIPLAERPPPYPTREKTQNGAVEYQKKASCRPLKLKRLVGYALAVLAVLAIVVFVWTLFYTDIFRLSLIGRAYDVTLIDGKIYVERWDLQPGSFFSVSVDHRPYPNDAAYFDKFQKETGGAFGFRYGRSTQHESIFGVSLLLLPIALAAAFVTKLVRRRQFNP